MKRLFVNTLVMVIAVLTMTACNDEKTIQQDELPAAATTFIATYFSDATITHAQKENDGLLGREFTVYLNDATEIEFDRDGDWVSVDGAEDASIPTGFILVPIVTYVSTTYSDATISSIVKERNGFDVDLTNGLDLEFDPDGNFARVD